MNILKKLENLENATPNERILIDYILRYPQNFIKFKPKEIASELYISIPTIYRLTNKLGFQGLNDLKLELKAALREESGQAIENIDFPISPSDSVHEIMVHLKDVYQRTLEDTLDLSEPDALLEAVSLMQQASVIDVYASAGNLFFAENFRFQMQEIDVLVNVPQEEYMQKLSAANSGPSHLSLVISFGGRGGSIDTICRILRDRQSPIVLITSTQRNPLCQYAQYIIYMSSYENHYQKISSFSTRLTLLYILDTLYSIYFRTHYKHYLDKKISTYEKIHKHLNSKS